MRLLVIDNHRDSDCIGAPVLREAIRQSQKGKNFSIFLRRAPEEDLPSSPKCFDKIILSGSRTSIFSKEAWILKLVSFTKSALELKIPVLGICFGHQILGLCLNGELGVCTYPQKGFKEVKQLEPSPLFQSMPSHFTVYCQNREEIKALPPETKILACSADSKIEAFQMKGAPIYGVQFHPEQSDTLNLKIFENFLKL